MRGYAGLVVGLIMGVLLLSVGAYVVMTGVVSANRISDAQRFVQQLEERKGGLGVSIESTQWIDLTDTVRILAKNSGRIGFDLNSLDVFAGGRYLGKCADLNCYDETSDGYVEPGEEFNVSAAFPFCPDEVVLSPGPGVFSSHLVDCSYAWLFFEEPPTPAHNATLSAGSSATILLRSDSSDLNRIYLDWNGFRAEYYPHTVGDSSIHDIYDANLILAMGFNNVAAVGEDYCSNPLSATVHDYSPYGNDGTTSATCWKYYRDINISNPLSADLNDYQVPIDLNSSNFDFTHANTDGSDIRFYLGSTELNYWIEYWDASGGSARVWVLIPSIPASSAVTIRMYYGNPGATSESNAERVFKAVIPDVIGAWLFDDPSNLGKDYSGNGLNGTVNGSVSSVSGARGGAAYFPGSGTDYIDVPYNSLLNPSGAFSVVVWYRPDDLSKRWYGIAVKMYSVYSSTPGGWNLCVTNSRFASLRSDLNGNFSYIYDGSAALGTWKFGALVYEPTPYNRIYDGNTLSATDNQLIEFRNVGLQIGRFYHGSGSLEFNGAVDELIYFARALTQEQINALYSGKAYFSPYHSGVAYVRTYSPTEPSISVGTENVSPMYYTGGRYGGTFLYNDFGYVTILDDFSLNPSSQITLGAWIRTSDADDQIVVGKDNAYLLGVVSSGKAYFNFYDGTGWNCFLYSNADVIDGKWHHIAATYDSSSGTARIYVDGALDNTASCSGTIAASMNPVRIGTLWAGWEFNGMIDDVVIYDRALSSDEIWWNAHAAQYASSGKGCLEYNTPVLAVGTYYYYGWAESTSGLTDYTHDLSDGTQYDSTNPRILNVT